MTTTNNKRYLLLRTLLHACPSTFFLNGEPFYAHSRYGWSLGQVALSQGLVGLCIAAGACFGGQIAHHRTPQKAIRIGLVCCVFGTLLGLGLTPWFGAPAMLAALAIVSFSQVMVWPGIETALVEAEPPARIQHFIGCFNLTWSLGTATAFLVATPLMKALGPNVWFALPAAFYLVHLGLPDFSSPPVPQPSHPPAESVAPSASLPPGGEPAGVSAYRWLGWLANPFSYIAINVIVSYNPTIGLRLGLGAAASVWCGLWFYVRMVAFELLRRWDGWHYRRGLLYGGYLTIMFSFAAMVLTPSLAVLLAAQVALGLSAGLLYQSSLFYSMAGSDAQGAHGGFHESFIGLGQMIGPLIAFGGARLVPTDPVFPVKLVLALMAVGLILLVGIGQRAPRRV